MPTQAWAWHPALADEPPVAPDPRYRTLGLSGAGKIRGQFLRDLARGGPFGTALVGDDEGHAPALRGGMPQLGVEHPAFAVVDRHQDRLVAAGPALFRSA